MLVAIKGKNIPTWETMVLLEFVGGNIIVLSLNKNSSVDKNSWNQPAKCPLSCLCSL